MFHQPRPPGAPLKFPLRNQLRVGPGALTTHPRRCRGTTRSARDVLGSLTRRAPAQTRACTERQPTAHDELATIRATEAARVHKDSTPRSDLLKPISRILLTAQDQRLRMRISPWTRAASRARTTPSLPLKRQLAVQCRSDALAASQTVRGAPQHKTCAFTERQPTTRAACPLSTPAHMGAGSARVSGSHARHMYLGLIWG